MSGILDFVKCTFDAEVTGALEIIFGVDTKAVCCNITTIKQVPKNIGIKENLVEKTSIGASIESVNNKLLLITIVSGFIALLILLLHDHWAGGVFKGGHSFGH